MKWLVLGAFIIGVMVLSTSLLFHGPRTLMAVALTFDDGPDVLTPDFLDVLARFNVSATFFVIGQKAQQHPELIERMRLEGHSVGVHSWSHSFPPPLTRSSFERDLFIGDSLYRPPWGIPSPAAFFVVDRIVLWDVNSRDYASGNAQEIAERVIGKARPGSIILLHDGVPASPLTLEALPLIIEGLRQKGFVFVKVEEFVD